MLHNAAQAVQQAFFKSLEQWGCVSLETTGPDSSDSEYEGSSSDEEEEEDGESRGVVLTPSRLVGFGGFLRDRPRTDKFKVRDFHHIELWCGDASNTFRRFSWGLGLPLVAKSDNTTGNHVFCSYALQCNRLTLVFTAPYSEAAAALAGSTSEGPSGTSAGPNPSGSLMEGLPVSSLSFSGGSLGSKAWQGGSARAAGKSNAAAARKSSPFPHFSAQTARKFFAAHGLAVRAVAVEVEDAEIAYSTAVAGGAVGVTTPFTVTDANEEASISRRSVVMAEVQLFGDVVLRFVEVRGAGGSAGGGAGGAGSEGAFLPGYAPATNQVMPYGAFRLDHVVGTVPPLHLKPTLAYIRSFSGFHAMEGTHPSSTRASTPSPSVKPAFAAGCGSSRSSDSAAAKGASETAAAPPLVASGVLGSDSERVVLAVVEPRPEAPCQTQAELFLEHHGGAGVQHLAFMSSDIVATVREMRSRSDMGGFAFLPRPSAKYYREAALRLGDAVTPAELKTYQELGIHVDKDERGVLLQIFTAPVGDRPTLLLEILQRRELAAAKRQGDAKTASALHLAQHTASGGCGGLDSQNVVELFRAMRMPQAPIE